MIDGRNYFDQLLKNGKRTLKENIRKIFFRSRRLLDYPYFEENYNLIAIDLSKQEALVANPKAIQCSSLLKS